MKILIHADCEGICGIRAFADASGTRTADVTADAKMQQLNEINACIDGLRSAGADEILVWDNCCTSGSPVFNIYDLRPGVFFADSRDPAGPVMHLDAGFDGAVLLGASARNHTEHAFMAHSVNSRIFDSLELNGTPVGDIGLNILTASYFRVPVLLVSGDDKACREASDFCGGEMETVETKKGLSCLKCMNHSPADVCRELTRKAEESLRKREVRSIRQMKGPYRLKVRVTAPHFLEPWIHMGYEPAAENTIFLESDDFLDLCAQLRGWSPGAHAKRFGVTSRTTDFFQALTLD